MASAVYETCLASQFPGSWGQTLIPKSLRAPEVTNSAILLRILHPILSRLYGVEQNGGVKLKILSADAPELLLDLLPRLGTHGRRSTTRVPQIQD